MPTIKRFSLKRLFPLRHDPGLLWENISKTAVVAAIFLLPLVVLPWGTDLWEWHKASMLLVFVSLAWVAMMIAAFRRRTFVWHWHPLDLLAVGYLAISGISTALSVNVWQSLTGLNGWLAEAFPVTAAMVGLYLIIGQRFHTPHERHLTLGAMLGGVVVSLLMQMVQFTGISVLGPNFPSQELFGTISSSVTQIAMLTAALAGVLLLWWSATTERWQRIGLVAGVALAWLVVFLLARPVGWAVFALGMIVVVLWQAQRGKQQSVRVIMIAVVLAALGLVAQLSQLAQHSSLPSTNEVTLDGRTSLTIAASTVKERSVLGSGPTTWYQDFVAYRPVSFNQRADWSTRYFTAGAEWWQLLATQGVVGMMWWLGLLVVGGWLAWQALLRRQIIGAITLLIGGVLLVSGFFTIWSLVLLGWWWIVLGLLRAETVNAPKAKPIGAGVTTTTILLVLSLVLFWWMGVRVYASDVQTQRAFSQTDDLAQAEKLLTSAARLNSHNILALDQLAGLTVIKAENAAYSNDQTANINDLVQQSLNWIKQAASRDPRNPAVYEDYNNILNRLGTAVSNVDELAHQNFITLRELEPVNPIHDVGFGQTLLLTRSRLLTKTDVTTADKQQAERNLADALAAYAEALNKKPDYDYARYAQSMALSDAGQYADALTAIERVEANNPNVSAILIQKANVLAKLQRNAEAEKTYTQAISVNPQDPSSYLAESTYYQQLGNKDKAKGILDQGLQAIPNDPDLTAQRQALDKT